MHRQFCQLVFPEPCLTFGKSFGVAATVQREVSLQNRVDDPSRQSLSLVEGPSARFHISPPVGRVLSLAGRSADRLTPVNPQHSHFVGRPSESRRRIDLLVSKTVNQSIENSKGKRKPVLGPTIAPQRVVANRRQTEQTHCFFRLAR